MAFFVPPVPLCRGRQRDGASPFAVPRGRGRPFPLRGGPGGGKKGDKKPPFFPPAAPRFPLAGREETAKRRGRALPLSRAGAAYQTGFSKR